MTSDLQKVLDHTIAQEDTRDMALTNLQERTPVEIDTELFPLRANRYFHHARVMDLRHTLAKTIWPVEYKDQYERYYRKFESKVYALDLRFGGERQVISHVKRLNEEIAAFDALTAEIAPYEAEYDRRPWERYLLVGGGHIHTQSRGCGSIRPTTRVMWLIEASGFDADEVVRKYSYTACTKCFPDAPVATVEIDEKVCTAGPYDHDRSRSNRYAKCNACGYTGALTTTGKLRKHNKEAAATGS